MKQHLLRHRQPLVIPSVKLDAVVDDDAVQNEAVRLVVGHAAPPGQVGCETNWRLQGQLESPLTMKDHYRAESLPSASPCW